jgi:hypothetical protein
MHCNAKQRQAKDSRAAEVTKCSMESQLLVGLSPIIRPELCAALCIIDVSFGNSSRADFATVFMSSQFRTKPDQGVAWQQLLA